MYKDHTSHQIEMMSTRHIGQDCQRLVHQERDKGMMLLIIIKLSGRADVVMREESRQHEGTVTWEVFQSMLIKHFYHIPSKKRAAKLLNKLQQDLHESIEEYVQRGSKIIQVLSGKTKLRDISTSQYGWNIVQGLANISIKNKITDYIANCHSLLDVCKLIRQVRREMENREAFRGISA